MVRASGAACFADPFLQATNGDDDLPFLSRTLNWLAPSRVVEPRPPRRSARKLHIEAV
jgi:hypothetical protein